LPLYLTVWMEWTSQRLGVWCVSVMFVFMFFLLGHNISIFVNNHFGTTTLWKGRN